MKRFFVILFMLFTIMGMINACKPKEEVSSNIGNAEITSAKNNDKITKDMAYNGVNNYCHITYDWSMAKDNPSIMSVEMGEETDTEHQVIFRSYTGSFVYFYVDKSSGITKMVDYVPDLDIKEESGTIDLLDYLGNDN
ncbi:MAG: hypothetical protein J6M39_01055 [Lachnospiraceae bacterium]|nr:hypothetical protein [Lachnospiraceae bacterium]